MFESLARQLDLVFYPPKNVSSNNVLSEPKNAHLSDAEAIGIHARRIAGLLSVLLPHPADVVFTNNRSTMVSFRMKQSRLEVRIHRMFRCANDDVIGALASFISGCRGDETKLLDAFIADNKGEIVSGKRTHRSQPVNPEGKHHNLNEILDRVRKTYFEGGCDVVIGWGRLRKPPRRRGRGRGGTRSRALATYSFENQTIRVSPVLDRAKVPGYVLDWVVYHELLHHVLPIEEKDGRRRFHTRRFRVLERAFDRYDEAKRWEMANLDWLLR